MDLNNLPDVSFVNTSVEEIIDGIITGFEQAYLEQTGTVKKLYPGDPIRIFLHAQALREFQLRQLIDYSAKQNLLKYSQGDYLIQLGANRTVTKLPAQKASVTVRFRLSNAQLSVYTIPAGTRVGPGEDILFETTSVIEIPPGQQEATAIVVCTQEGIIGNGFAPGQINIITDPLPYLESVENITTSSGGSDIESDENFRERIYLAPEGYSVAGPEAAYIYQAKSYSPLVLDVKASSPSDGVVEVKVLLEDGEIPSAEFITGVSEHLNARDKRPLTDKLEVSAPDTITYNIDLDYYILNSNSSAVAAIQQNVNKAISDYKLWQRSKIGRDIDPTELVARIKGAGAKRVVVRSPIFQSLTDEVGIIDNETVIYGGLEDD